MFHIHFKKFRFSILRAGLAGLLLAATCVVSVGTQSSVVKADAGEAPYGTATQAYEAAISLGDSHTCVIVNGVGNLLCWGINSYGQLGNGQSNISGTLVSNTPTYVMESSAAPTTRLSGVIAVAAASNHTCALLSSGKVKCWGLISSNLLGRYATYQFATQAYPEFVKSEFTDAASLAASADLTNVVAIATATYASCALINDGTVKCWGEAVGHEGNGVGYVTQCTTPDTAGSCDFTTGLPISGIKQINMAGQTSCGLKTDGSMLCWGADNSMFANSSYTSSNSPYPKNAGSSVNGAKAFGTAQYSQCGLYQNGASSIASVGGTVKCWGANNSGEIAQPGTTPSSYTANSIGITNAIAVAGHERSYCALIIDGTVKCWGGNTANMFSAATGNAAFYSPTAMLTGGNPVTGVKALSVGTSHVCLIMGSGAVRCSGSNGQGQLGDGTVTARATLTDVVAPVGGGGGSLTGAGADNVAPVFSSSAVSSDGSKVVLTYNEPLSSSELPSTSSFTLKIGGAVTTIASISVSGSTIELNLPRRINSSTAVLMSYADPTNGDDTAATQDVSFNDSASITERSVANASSADIADPVLVSGDVNSAGTKLILTYNETLNATTAATSAFAVTVGGVSRTVSSVAVVGSTVELTLASTVQSGQTVAVSYTAPTYNLLSTNNAIQDTVGNDAASFAANAITVTNSSTVDTTAPTLVSRVMNSDGTKVVLTYNEALSATTAASSAFAVVVAGTARTVTAVARGTDTSTIEITLASAVTIGQIVTMTYTAPTVNAATSNAAIQDTSGNDAASITSGSSVTNTDSIAPTLVSRTVNTAGTKLILTYNESLNSTTAASSAFAVTVGGTSRGVSSVAIVGSTVELTLASTIDAGQTVTVAYTAPSSDAGTSNAAIQDSAGNDAAAFTAASQSVTNSSTADTTAPTLVSRAVNSAGTKLILTYNEALNSTTAATSAFAVTVVGSARSVSSVAVVGSTVELTLATNVESGEVVAVAYTAPAVNAAASNAAIQDTAGNDAASFTAASQGVTNGSTIDTVSPTFVSGTVDTGGTTLTLTMSETLSTATAGNTAITVTVGGVVVTVTSISIVGRTVVVTVSPAITAGQTVTVAYVDPTSGNDANAVQDSTGNDVAGFGPVAVTNNLTQVTANTPSEVVDGDSADKVSFSPKIISGKKGTAKFGDGSTFTVAKNGNLIPKLFTGYVGIVTGSVKVSYLSGKKTVSTTCSYGKYGSNKAKKVKRVPGGFYPKVFIAPKKSCVLSKGALAALNTGLVTISAKLKFARRWPTTGLPKNPESGAAVNPVNRSYTVKIGTTPK